MTIDLRLGDCLEMLPTLESESVDLAFTSPPYFNAREYSQFQSYEDYLLFIEQTAKQLNRVIKEGRYFICNTSPVIEPRLNRSHQSTRRAIPFDIHPLIIRAGFTFTEDIIWVKPEPSAANRVRQFNQNRQPLSYKPNPVAEYVIVYRKTTSRLPDWNIQQYPKEIRQASKINGTYERSNIWEISPARDKNHPAVFPVELADKAISFYSFIGDTVVDCFMGTGTTGDSAARLNRNFIGIEKEPKYFEIAQRRIKQAQQQMVMEFA